MEAVDKGFYYFDVSVGPEAAYVRSAVALMSSATTEACSATAGSRIPRLVESSFKGEAVVVLMDCAVGIELLAGCEGFVCVGR